MSEPPERGPATDCLYYLVTRVSLLTTALLKTELAEGGVPAVKPSYLSVLMSLWETDGVPVSEVARKSGLGASSATGLLDRMEQQGIVRRAADPLDRRSVRIFLTEGGRAMEPDVRRVVNQALAEGLHGLDEDAVEGTRQSLIQVLGNLEERMAQGRRAGREGGA